MDTDTLPTRNKPVPDAVLEQIRSLYEDRAEPTLLSISGGSSTGKSTQVVAQLTQAFEGDIAVVPTDCMMGSHIDPKSLDPQYRWDHPNCYGLAELRSLSETLRHEGFIQLPIYDFQTQRNVGARDIHARGLIIIEGLYANYGPLEAFADYTLYLESPVAVRLIRRCFRNMYERYRLPDPSRVIEGFFRSVLPAHRTFVSEQRKLADAVLDIPYHFADTLSRFNCRKWSAPKPQPKDLWVKIPGARIYSIDANPPRLHLQADDGTCYFDCQIIKESHDHLRSTNPNER